MVPTVSLDTYQAARHRAALISRTDRGRLVVSGGDRASYLQGLLTNDVLALKIGEGCYAAYLTPQGRMITDLWVYELGDVMLVTLNVELKDLLLERLDQFIFSEDVKLGDVTGTFDSVVVVGPDAARIVAHALGGTSETELATLPEHGNRRVTFNGEPAIVLSVSDLGVRGYEVVVNAPGRPALEEALRGDGAVPADAGVAETLRVEGGMPRFHRDMDEHTIPLEAGIESRAISLTKGCYVGQEVIIRVLHRGHGRVARKLVGLVLEGDSVPAAATHVHVDDREVGHVTSSVFSPALQRPIALAYLQRDYIEPGTAVSVSGARAVVTTLPFVPSM